MPEPTTMQALGLATSPNELSETSPGDLVKAQNCMVLADGLMGSRPGLPPLSYAPSKQSVAMTQYATAAGVAETIIINTEDVESDATIEYKASGSFNTLCNAAPPDASLLRMKFMEASKNLYATTDEGILRIDQINPTATPLLAGGPFTQQIATAATNATASGYLPTGYSVAYRLVFGFYDAHGTPHLGDPSGRFVVDNTSGGAHNVALTWLANYISDDRYPNATFWQLYRTISTQSFQTVDGVTSVYVPPSDEMFLCQEAYFTVANVAGGVSITDTTPDAFLGTPLYTNAARGDGTLQRNDVPPLAKDLCNFDECAFYFNTSRAERITLHILGVGAGQDGYTGIRLGDTLTLSYNGVFPIDFRASTAYSASDKTFLLYTASGDAAVNIATTAQSLIRLINAVAYGNQFGWFAEDLSIPDGLGVASEPGVIGIRTQVVSSGTFNAGLNTYKFPVAVTTGLTRSGTTVTCSTGALSHGYIAGDTVRIDPTGTVDANYAAGAFTVLPGGLTATAFTYTQAGTGTACNQPYTVRRLTPEPQYAWAPPPPPSVFRVEIGGLVQNHANTVVTATTSVAHGLSVGQVIPLEPVTTADSHFPKGNFTVATVPSTTSFTYAQVGTADAVSTTVYQSGARVTSDPLQALNGVSFSKYQEPEAVPEANSFAVGAPDKQILRGVALQNYCFVFKEDGIFTISPTGNPASPYRVDPLDTTVHVYAPDSVAVLHNRIFALTNQGVVSVTSSGVKIVSGKIEQDLFQYFGPTLSTVRTFAWGIAHETARIYVLTMPPLVGGSGVYASARQYVYSTIANGGQGAWTNWEKPMYCGVVRRSDDTLFAGDYDSEDVYQQNNTKTAADYNDGIAASFAATSFATTATGGVVTVVSTTGAVVGNSLGPTDLTSGQTGIITAIDASAKTITVTNTTPAISFATNSEWEVKFLATSGDVGAVIDGHTITVPTQGTDDLTAIAFRAAVIANSTTNALVSTTIANNFVQLFERIPGPPAIVVTATGFGASINQNIPGTNGDCVSYAAIPIDLEWRTLSAGSPADMKTFREIHLHSRIRSFYKGTLEFASELVPTAQDLDVYPAKTIAGVVPAYNVNSTLYPGTPVRPKKLRIHVPQSVARAAYFSVAWKISEAFAVWTLNGFSMGDAAVSEKGQR